MQLNQGKLPLNFKVLFKEIFSYSKQLERWNSEWNCYAEKHFKDCLSLRNTFDLILGEGRELAKIHHAVKERFVDEVKLITLKSLAKQMLVFGESVKS